MLKSKTFCLIFGVNTSKYERTTALCVKLNTCRGIPQANISSERLMFERGKSGVFFADRVGFKVSILEISQAGTSVIQSQHSNVQVSIFVTCLNFAGTGSQILLNPVSLCRRVIPSRKISLNFNGEISYRELARRPWNRVDSRHHQGSTLKNVNCIPANCLSLRGTSLFWMQKIECSYHVSLFLQKSVCSNV